MKFHKYHGTGNDFILLDNRGKSITLTAEDIQQLCNRKCGIGADGLILLNPSKQADFEMVFYNNDGSTDTFCGNGGRCIAAFANRLGLLPPSPSGLPRPFCLRHFPQNEKRSGFSLFEREEKGCFLASDGIHQFEIVDKPNQNETIVRISLKECTMPQQFSDNIFFINTGSPHLVIFKDKIENLDVLSLGKQHSNDPRIQGRTNVNFVERKPDYLLVRTFERGVEDETLSCGTGIVASVLTYAAHFLENIQQNVITAESRGGTLKVYYTKTDNIFHDVYLEGLVSCAFAGEIFMKIAP